MADPQVENGHTDIANEILEALCRVNLSSYETRILFCVIRKTYGWKKKNDWISLSQFSKYTCLDRRHAHRAIKRLLNKKVLVLCRDNKKHPTYGFQKDYEKWVSSVEMTSLAEQMRERKRKKSARRDDKVVPVEAPTKEIITKETLKKEKEREGSSSLKHENQETPSPKGMPLCFLFSGPGDLRERLKLRGYRLTGAQMTTLLRRLGELGYEKGDIPYAEIERVIVKEIIGYVGAGAFARGGT